MYPLPIDHDCKVTMPATEAGANGAALPGSPTTIRPDELVEESLDDTPAPEVPVGRVPEATVPVLRPAQSEGASATKGSVQSQEGHTESSTTEKIVSGNGHTVVPNGLHDEAEGEQGAVAVRVPPEIATEDLSDGETGGSPSFESPNRPSRIPSARVSFQKPRRRASVAMSISSIGGTEIKGAMVFIRAALEKIKASKDAKRIPALDQALNKVLGYFQQNSEALPSPALIMEPLRIVCAQGSLTSMRVVALDCIGKLFTFGYLEDEPERPVPEGVTPAPFVPLINRAIDIVCDTFEGESTDSGVELQIIKAIMAAIVNEDIILHGPPLLKAVRQIYNIFVVSRSPENQTIAQVSLTQTVQVVFDRVKIQLNPIPQAGKPGESEGHSRSGSVTAPTLASSDQLGLTLEQMKTTSDDDDTTAEDSDLAVQDAFFLFRTLCKLSDKTDTGSNDLRSHAMRAKLLSLHLLHLTLKQHISVFAAKTLTITFKNRPVRFVDAVKIYLASTLSRNAPSNSPAIYEIAAEIFWLLLSNLRAEFKREIEVFFKEVYFTILDMPTATVHQKLFFLEILHRLSGDPRALVELYLNYDCDADSVNIFELAIQHLARFATMVVSTTSAAIAAFKAERNHRVALYNLNQPPSVAIAHIIATGEKLEAVRYPREYAMKLLALDSLVSVLRSLYMWYHRDAQKNGQTDVDSESNSVLSANASRSDIDLAENPQQFEGVKTNKKALSKAVAEFNYKPERGVKMLIDLGIIEAKNSKQLAMVFLKTNGFDLTLLGEYLAKNDPFNKAVMHDFVHSMDFRGVSFIEALRQLMQSFRLPGEGQVVDRYLLEFGDKYQNDNPTVFSSAETPYVLGYSVMLLNTDQHSPNMKSRMSLADFISNNRGINDGLDLPEEFMRGIYNEIVSNEIKLVSEHEDAALKGHNVQGRNTWLGGRVDNSAEAYMAASEVISTKTAKLFKSMMAKDRKAHSVYYYASHVEHVQPMFEDVWMSVFSALSGIFQQSSDKDVTQLSLEGFSLATKIACHFNVSLAREAFVPALSQFAGLANLHDLKPKGVQAALTLLRVGLAEGDNLHESWFNVLALVSQLERAQLVAKGVTEGSLPGVDGIKSRQTNASHYLSADAAERLLSEEVEVTSDRIFTQSSRLNGAAIVQFTKALSRVSVEEIQTSKTSTQPRLFSLQKTVDVCYYNMQRIKMEWSQIWAVMGDLFNKVGSNSNEQVVMFALDSLRQLSVRFLDLEELPHFKFQREFLKPFSYVMDHNQTESARALVVDCLTQMVSQKSAQLRSGWTTIFTTLSIASKTRGRTLLHAFELLSIAASKYQDQIFSQDESVVASYLTCLSNYAKQSNVKVALRAVEFLKSLYDYSDDMKLWRDLSEQVHDVIMDGQDLEVRGRALENQFEYFMSKGSRFSVEEWDKICRDQLFPLFYVLETPKEKMTDDMNVWMSTTLVQALRSIVALFHRHFDKLEHALNDFFLDLLKSCICQENETVSRIGSSCLVQLVAENAPRFTDQHWQQVAAKIELIFRHMTATELTENLPDDELPNQNRAAIIRTAIQKCIQQLLMIETVNDLLSNQEVFRLMPIADLVRVTDRVLKSYEFAREFNSNQDLRRKLWQLGFMKELPNLTLQESSAAMVYVNASFRLFRDKERFTGDSEAREEVRSSLIPLSETVLHDYNVLQPQDNRQIKSIVPVVIAILREVRSLDVDDFKRNVRPLYMEVIEVLNKDMSADLRESVQAVLRRVAEVHIADDTGKH